MFIGLLWRGHFQICLTQKTLVHKILHNFLTILSIVLIFSTFHENNICFQASGFYHSQYHFCHFFQSFNFSKMQIRLQMLLKMTQNV